MAEAIGGVVEKPYRRLTYRHRENGTGAAPQTRGKNVSFRALTRGNRCQEESLHAEGGGVL